MNQHQEIQLKKIPKVDKLIEDGRIQDLINRFPRSLVVDSIRRYLDGLRRDFLQSETPLRSFDYQDIVDDLVVWTEIGLGTSMKRAVNGTGIILHTGLGRAPFAGDARQALNETAAGYCTLQIDCETGKRGDRHAHVEGLLQKLTGAESALVVNNNAAATLLILNTLAEGKEVIVSRGELVEIGGSFRIPDVLQRSGAKLVETGTTNRTHLKDYEGAVTPETGLILRVHQSNYRIVGFTKQVPLDELVTLARAKGVPVVDDLGSGAMVDFSRWGLPKEPTVQESVRAGADVVCFSGDKLIGGPQSGIVIGKAQFISRMKKNPLMRALRVDKMTYAALEATLRLFFDEARLIQAHPVLRMLTEPADAVRKRCLSLKRKMKTAAAGNIRLNIVKEYSETGSGSLAAEPLPTFALSVEMDGLSAEELAIKFRKSNPPIFGRVKYNRFLLDCRTIQQDELGMVESAFRKITQSLPLNGD